jgi:transcriptional antiterminator NusG
VSSFGQGRRGWYVIYTHTGQESKVKANIERMVQASGLDDRVFRVEVPMEEETRMVQGRKKTIRRKVYPGYVLVEMVLDDETWTSLRNTAGVTGFVGGGRRPVPLTPAEAESILQSIGDEPMKIKPRFEKGDTVMVLTEPFTEFHGKVEEVYPSREKLRVRIEIFGRETPVELDYAQVEKL